MMQETLRPARTELEWCVVVWNPGEWPYATRCRLSPDHTGSHVDHKGRRLSLSPAQTKKARGR